jgi:DNA topoisomerase II
MSMPQMSPGSSRSSSATCQGSTKFSVSLSQTLILSIDEVLVNAADNIQRDKKTSIIKVEIDQKKGLIKVWNNGSGIPIQEHKEHKCFVPELVFGHLLTSSNFDE